MKNAIFKTSILLLLILIMVYVFGNLPPEHILNEKTELYDYYINNGFNETLSRNLVTAIYLEYRLFDSVFEALLLLIATLGIAFISKRGGEIDG